MYCVAPVQARLREERLERERRERQREGRVLLQEAEGARPSSAALAVASAMGRTVVDGALVPLPPPLEPQFHSQFNPALLQQKEQRRQQHLLNRARR